MNKNYILKELKKANKLNTLILKFFSRLNIKELNKTMNRLTKINNILTDLEIYVGGINNE